MQNQIDSTSLQSTSLQSTSLNSTSLFDVMDSAEVQDAMAIYTQFNKDNLSVNVDKAKKYVDEVRNLCISLDVQSPLIDSMIDMEKMNINLLCRQVHYAMHAIDSIFNKIDSEGGDIAAFGMMLHLQNDAMRLVQTYISYVRQLPHVIAAFNRNVQATQVDTVESNQNDSTVAKQIAEQTGVIVTRSVVDLIKAAETHVSKFEEIKESATDDDDDDLKPLFEMSPEAAELYSTEKYVDKPTYAESMQIEGKDFDAAKEIGLQAKKES